jgi:hypothetical protein
MHEDENPEKHNGINEMERTCESGEVTCAVFHVKKGRESNTIDEHHVIDPHHGHLRRWIRGDVFNRIGKDNGE